MDTSGGPIFPKATMTFRRSIHHLIIGAGSLLAPSVPVVHATSPLDSIGNDFRRVGWDISQAMQATPLPNGSPRIAQQLEFEEIARAARR
ncbi:MAG: hypothetical protein H2170_06820 [Opitutus sp.]|nr:hypothetical protein [Opitutus sp.]